MGCHSSHATIKGTCSGKDLEKSSLFSKEALPNFSEGKVNFLLSCEATYMTELKNWLVGDNFSVAQVSASARKYWIRAQP